MTLTGLNVVNYARATRGKNMDFFATDDEMSNLLLFCLPKDFAPYSLLCIQSEQTTSDHYKHQICELPIEQFYTQRQAGQWEFFIRSAVVTPTIKLGRYAYPDRLLSLSGLPILHQGVTRKGFLTESSLGMVNIIYNKTTGEQHKHELYLKIYNQLRRALSKLVCFRAEREMLDGTKLQTKGKIVSAGFAEALNAEQIKSRIKVLKNISRTQQ